VNFSTADFHQIWPRRRRHVNSCPLENVSERIFEIFPFRGHLPQSHKLKGVKRPYADQPTAHRLHCTMLAVISCCNKRAKGGGLLLRFFCDPHRCPDVRDGHNSATIARFQEVAHGLFKEPITGPLQSKMEENAIFSKTKQFRAMVSIDDLSKVM